MFNDIFVFDPTSKGLVWTILGARFTKVLITSLTKVLFRASGNKLKTNTTNIAAYKNPRSPINEVSNLEAKTLQSTAEFTSELNDVSSLN